MTEIIEFKRSFRWPAKHEGEPANVHHLPVTMKSYEVSQEQKELNIARWLNECIRGAAEELGEIKAKEILVRYCLSILSVDDVALMLFMAAGGKEEVENAARVVLARMMEEREKRNEKNPL